MTTMTKAIQEQMTPEGALERLKEGHERFLNGSPAPVNLMEQVEISGSGQFPFAAILGCVDSRAAAELLFDQGIGDIFNVRIAGNIVNGDILGSLEFACKVSGSKLILVLGHTSCGAVTAAVNRVELGNITPMVSKILPAVESVEDASQHVNTVAEKNVMHSIDTIRENSPILAEMESKGEIMITGAMYDVKSGRIAWL